MRGEFPAMRFPSVLLLFSRIAAARPMKYRDRTSSWDASPAPANFRATGVRVETKR
jgi:hypothetical protein